jgi:hypothetical protein
MSCLLCVYSDDICTVTVCVYRRHVYYDVTSSDRGNKERTPEGLCSMRSTKFYELPKKISMRLWYVFSHASKRSRSRSRDVYFSNASGRNIIVNFESKIRRRQGAFCSTMCLWHRAVVPRCSVGLREMRHRTHRGTRHGMNSLSQNITTTIYF